jgi:glycosyltransferase involved in cell wall biosynthesis
MACTEMRSVLMPVNNERATVEDAVRRVRGIPLGVELVVIDDGSTDGSDQILGSLADLNLSDMETCYKIKRADLAKSLPLRSERFGIEPEIVARLAQAGPRIYKVPVSYHGRTYAEGKKIAWRGGVGAFWHTVRSNVARPTRRP